MKYNRKYEQAFTFNEKTRGKIYKGSKTTVEFDWRDGDIGYFHTHPYDATPSTDDLLILGDARYMVIQAGRTFLWVDVNETPKVKSMIARYKRLRKPGNKRKLMIDIKKELKFHKTSKMPEFVPK